MTERDRKPVTCLCFMTFLKKEAGQSPAWSGPTPTMGSTFQQGSPRTLQPRSLRIRFNDLILIALRIYLLVRRKTTTSQGLPAGVRKTGLPPQLHARGSGFNARMWPSGRTGMLKGQGPGQGGGSASSSKQASWGGNMVARQHYLVRFFVFTASPPIPQTDRIAKL